MSENTELWQVIKDKPYCDPSRRMDFVLLFDVKDGNPNGDSDAGNLPRMDPTTGHGIVTDVCIKRKIRDYLANVLGRPIYIQSQDALNTLYFRAARQIGTSGNDDECSDEQKKQMADDKEAVESLLAELSECDDDSFRQLIELPEARSVEDEDTAEESADENEVQTKRREFREWLAHTAGKIDGLDFDPEGGTLRYLGEAKSKKNFQDLLSQEELEPEPFREQISKLADLIAKAKPAKSAKQRQAREAIKSKMCQLYEDIRLFGAVLTAGTNAGQIRGPMQLKFARSVKPILQQDAAITRCAITKESDRMRKETEFGRKAWLSYAAYRQHGYFNAPLAKSRENGGTGITRGDLARFWEALGGMFPNSQSASKGEMATQDLIVFVHPNSRGNAPAHRLLDRVTESFSGRPRLGFGDDGKDEDDELIAQRNIKVHRPLRDLWGDL